MENVGDEKDDTEDPPARHHPDGDADLPGAGPLILSFDIFSTVIEVAQVAMSAS